MRRRHGFVALAVTAGFLAGGAPAAEADLVPPPDGYGACSFSRGTLSSTTLVVGATHDRSVQAHLNSSGCGSFAVVDGDEGASGNPYLSFDSSVTGYLYSDDGDPTDIQGAPTASPHALSNSVAGKRLRGIVELPDGTTRAFPGPTLTLKRKTAARIDAPSRVKRSKPFSVDGGLESADWDEGEYGQAFKKTVRLQSRVGNGRWKTITTLRTLGGNVEGGNLYARTKIKKKSCFRWVYAGDKWTAPTTSSQDCVKIKR